eukprot:4687396-Amphidinium_carterae.2
MSSQKRGKWLLRSGACWEEEKEEGVALLFIDKGCTSVVQPCNTHFVSLVDVALKATLSHERRKVAWAGLSCNESNLTQVLDEADELHTAGVLFPSNAETKEVVAVEDGEKSDEGVCEVEEVDERGFARWKMKWRMCGKGKNCRFVVLRLVYGSAHFHTSQQHRQLLLPGIFLFDSQRLAYEKVEHLTNHSPF